jgi:hypothetical protein
MASRSADVSAWHSPVEPVTNTVRMPLAARKAA